MRIEFLQEEDIPLWEEFVLKNDRTSNYHRIGWRRVIEESFGHSTHYLAAKDDLGNLAGLLPLVFMKSRLFGRFLVSMPFFNYGGIVANSAVAEEGLLKAGAEIAGKLGAEYIELRQDRPGPWGLPVKTHKVAMILDLPSDSETLWAGFSSKLRSQIRRPMKEGMEARWGGIDQLDAFYHVFSINMRDLGTPVYGKGFFRKILEVFTDQVMICVIYWKGKPLAGGFLSSFKNILEIPWASSLRKFNSLSPNMLLYWSVLEYACDKGYRRFDFGRSTVGRSAYKFKEQWGARPSLLYWHYHLVTGGALPELNVDNPKYRMAIGLWKRLPVWITRRLGPSVVRGIA